MQPTNDQMDSMEKTKALYYFVYYIAQDIKYLISNDFSKFLGIGQRLGIEVTTVFDSGKSLFLVAISDSEAKRKESNRTLVNNTFQLILKHISYIYESLRKAGLKVSPVQFTTHSRTEISIIGSIGKFVQLYKDASEEYLLLDNISDDENLSVQKSFKNYFKEILYLIKEQNITSLINSRVERLAMNIIDGKVKEAKDKGEDKIRITFIDVLNFIDEDSSDLIFRFQDDVDIYNAAKMVFDKVKEILDDIERELSSYSDFKLSATMDEHETEVIAVDINVSHPEFRNWWQRYTAKLSLKNLHNKDKLNTGLDTEQKIDVLVAIRKLITQNESYIALKALEDTSSVDEMFVVYNALSADRCEKNQCPITINLVVPYNINYGSYITYIEAFAKACGYFDDLSIKNLNQNECLVSFSCELIDLLDCFLWEAGYIQRDMIAQDDKPSNENESCEINGIRFEVPDKTLQLLRLANAKPVNNNSN